MVVVLNGAFQEGQEKISWSWRCQKVVLFACFSGKPPGTRIRLVFMIFWMGGRRWWAIMNTLEVGWYFALMWLMMLFDFWKLPKNGQVFAKGSHNSEAPKTTTWHTWLIEGGCSSVWNVFLWLFVLVTVVLIGALDVLDGNSLVFLATWRSGHYMTSWSLPDWPHQNYQQKQGSHIVVSKIVLKDNGSEM